MVFFHADTLKPNPGPDEVKKKKKKNKLKVPSDLNR